MSSIGSPWTPTGDSPSSRTIRSSPAPGRFTPHESASLSRAIPLPTTFPRRTRSRETNCALGYLGDNGGWQPTRRRLVPHTWREGNGFLSLPPLGRPASVDNACSGLHSSGLPAATPLCLHGAHLRCNRRRDRLSGEFQQPLVGLRYLEFGQYDRKRWSAQLPRVVHHGRHGHRTRHVAQSQDVPRTHTAYPGFIGTIGPSDALRDGSAETTGWVYLTWYSGWIIVLLALLSIVVRRRTRPSRRCSAEVRDPG